MAIITREAFAARQKELAEKAATGNFGSNGPQVGFFSLKNDGDEAIVRFMCDSPEEFPMVLQHGTRIGDGKYKTISCLREGYHDSYDKCPLCKAGDKAVTQTYIKLIQYTRDDDGKITASPKVWGRSNQFIQQQLMPKYEEYENLKNIVCKIKRHGAPNQTGVQYVITKLPSDIYSDDRYIKDEHAFDGYNLIGRAVRNMSYDDMQKLVGETTEETKVATKAATNSASTTTAELQRTARNIVTEDFPF